MIADRQYSGTRRQCVANFSGRCLTADDHNSSGSRSRLGVPRETWRGLFGQAVVARPDIDMPNFDGTVKNRSGRASQDLPMQLVATSTPNYACGCLFDWLKKKQLEKIGIQASAKYDYNVRQAIT